MQYEIAIIRGLELFKKQGKAMVELVYDILVLIALARSQGSDEPAPPRSLARAFAAVAIMKIVNREMLRLDIIPLAPLDSCARTFKVILRICDK